MSSKFHHPSTCLQSRVFMPRCKWPQTLQGKLLLEQRIRYSKTFKAKKSQVVHHLSRLLHKMIIKPLCGKSFMAIFHIKRRINIVQRIIFVLLILQISALFSYKLGILCLILTCLVSLGTILFILIKFSKPFVPALIDHLKSNSCSNNVEDTLSE